MALKSKTWELVLYLDNDRHKEIYDELILNACHGCRYVGIVHDSDVTENGELKKTHCHVVLCEDDECSIGQIESRFPNLESNLISKKNNRKEAVKYLLHITANARKENKHIYPKENLFGDNNFMAKYVGEDTHGSMAIIFEWIESCNVRDCTFTNLMRFCLENGIENTYRKYSFIIREMIKEKERGI